MDESRNRQEILLRLFEAYVNVYKHHWDALLKAYFLYFASAGVIAGLEWRNVRPAAGEPLLWILVVGSLLAILGGLLALWWFHEYSAVMKGIASELKVELLPFKRERLIVVTLILTAVLFLVGCLWILETS